MKQQYIPLEKRSKREQRAYYTTRRGSWGALNPVTRKPPNPKAYDRKKSGQRYDNEPLPGFCFILTSMPAKRVKSRNAVVGALRGNIKLLTISMCH